MHTYAHEHTWACMTPSTRSNTVTETHNICTNMHTHTHTHLYKRIHIHMHTHMHIYTYIHVCTHTHIHIYPHTHTKCTYTRTQARLERRCGSDRARSWCKRRKPCTSLSFDPIKPHLAPPMLRLYCTHFETPKPPQPLIPSFQHTLEQFAKMAHCIVVEKLEGKQRCSRAP